jgi:hypothetical protein
LLVVTGDLRPLRKELRSDRRHLEEKETAGRRMKLWTNRSEVYIGEERFMDYEESKLRRRWTWNEQDVKSQERK